MPTSYDIGNHIAKISIRSGAKRIEREIPFTVKEIEMQSYQQKNRTYTTIFCHYNQKTGTISLKGCLKETVQNPEVTMGSTTIPLKKDQKNCFNTKISTSSLSPGNHTLEVKDNMRVLYTKMFTIPETHQNNLPGNIIPNPSYMIPMILLALLILFLLLIARRKRKKTGYQ